MKDDDIKIMCDSPLLFKPKRLPEAIKESFHRIEIGIDPTGNSDVGNIVEELLSDYVRGSFPTDEEIIELFRLHNLNSANEKYNLFPLCMSYYLTKLAEKFLQSNNRELAWAALSEALYHCASIRAHKAAVNWHSKGGRSRAQKNIIPVRMEIIRLLKEKCPPGKWQSEKLAAKAIVHDSISFITNKKIAMSSSLETHTRTIITWMKNDPDVSAAYRECCSKK